MVTPNSNGKLLNRKLYEDKMFLETFKVPLIYDSTIASLSDKGDSSNGLYYLFLSCSGHLVFTIGERSPT